jgi:predicted small lipoprotein YifL
MFKKILILSSLLAIIVGCGFKGPLYLPSKEAKPEPTKKQNVNTDKKVASSPDRYRELQNEQD